MSIYRYSEYPVLRQFNPVLVFSLHLLHFFFLPIIYLSIITIYINLFNKKICSGIKE